MSVCVYEFVCFEILVANNKGDRGSQGPFDLVPISLRVTINNKPPSHGTVCVIHHLLVCFGPSEVVCTARGGGGSDTRTN